MTQTAFLGNKGNYTSFSYGDKVIRFRTSSKLIKYTKIVEWDNGYIVVMAKYGGFPNEIEEYIDLLPILENLYMEPKKFLQNIKEVKIADD